MSSNNDIGLARKQRVFASLESTVGTMVFPSGTTDFIRPVGNAAISQTPVFADSEELQNTLDVLDQFQGATPAGKWNLAMYLRPTGSVSASEKVQGSLLLKVLQGLDYSTVTAKFASDPGATAATVVVNTIAGGFLPKQGVVIGASEKIRYTGITRTSRTATTATLTGCTRGYASSTAATHTAGNSITIAPFYAQSISSPTFSLWVETDHFVQGLSGCSIENATFDISKDGAVKVSFDGQGMQMVWAGSSALTESAVATNTHIHVTDASLFSVGAYIYNSTAGTMVRKITAVDETTNTLTLSTSVQGATWTTAGVIRGYLPPGTEIGDPIESKDTVITIDDVTTKVKTGSISFKTPKKYIEDEVGTEYPTDFIEDKREITSSLGLYFKKADAKYFANGFNGTEVEVNVQFGSTAGSIVDILLPRCQLTIPAINFAAPAVELSIPIKALGNVGEDSAEITVR